MTRSYLSYYIHLAAEWFGIQMPLIKKPFDYQTDPKLW